VTGFFMELQEDSITEQDNQPQEPTLKEKTAKGFFWGGISSGVQQVLVVVFGIILARTLNPEDYGLVETLAIFTAIANIIINSGFSVALTNKQNATQKDYNAVFWFSFITGLALYSILYFCAPLIAAFYGRPELVTLSRVVFISFFFSGIAIVPYTIMFKGLMVKQQAVINIISVTISGISGITLALKGYSYWALAIQGVLVIVVGACLRLIVSPWRPNLHVDFTPLKEMFSFSSKLFLTNIFQQIQGNIFSVLLFKYYNATQLGYYSQGSKWMNIVSQLITGMFTLVVQPVIVQVNDNKDRQLRIFRKMIRLAAFLVFPAFLGLSFIAKEFVLIAVGEKWFHSVVYLQIMCGWGMVAPFIILYTQLIISRGKSTLFLRGTLIIGCLQIAMLFILFFMNVPILSLVACFVISYCLSLFYWHYCAKNLIGIKLIHLIKDISPYLIISVIAISLTSLLFFYVENIYILFIGKIITVAVIYITTLWFMKSKILLESIVLLKKRIL
jgi:O-antigen/teichoic acid export membrane protein